MIKRPSRPHEQLPQNVKTTDAVYKAIPKKPKPKTAGTKKKRGSTKGMVKVPEGSFFMGPRESTNEQPTHRVYISTFWIDKTEVTVKAYLKCVDAGTCKPPRYTHNDGEVFNWAAPGRGDHPTNGVTWNQAKAYCEWAGKRLPTEAEWEKAARGTDGRKYPWGNGGASCSVAVMDDGGGNGCGKDSTWPVGSKPSGASPYGALDMAGNVYEWTADWYDENYYANAPNKNPRGPQTGSMRVYRGGSFISDAAFLRAFGRSSDVPLLADFDLGFRCAR